MTPVVSNICNEKGSIMVLVLMVMSTIMVIGMIATHEAVVEGRIVRNYRVAQENFYRAEGAAKEIIQQMDNTGNPTANLIPGGGGTPAWLLPFGFDLNTTGPADATPSTLMANAGYQVVYQGRAPGESGDMSDPTSLYRYGIYGRGGTGKPNDPASTMVELGYQRRF